MKYYLFLLIIAFVTAVLISSTNKQIVYGHSACSDAQISSGYTSCTVHACPTGTDGHECCRPGDSCTISCTNGSIMSGGCVGAYGYPTPVATPNCNATISCSACSTTDTITRTTCVYTTYTGGGTCTQATAPNQTCSSGYSCSSGSCVDNTTPVGSLNINSGATSSTSRIVTLNLSATDGVGVTGYFVSETSTTPTASATGWVAVTSTTSYLANVSYTLASDGAKTVYAWYKDTANNISTVASKSITITTQPQLFTITTTNSSSSAKGCWGVGKPYIDLSWQASAGADQYLIYRALPNQTYSLIATGVTATTYRDPTPDTRTNPPAPNTTYSYQVTARNNYSANVYNSLPVEIRTLWCDYEKPTAIITNIIDTCYSQTSWTSSKTIQASAVDPTSGISSVDFKLTNLTTNTESVFSAVSAGGFWTADIARVPYLIEDHQYKLEVMAKDSADNLVPTDPAAPPNSSGWIGAKLFDFRSSCAGTSTTTTSSFVCQKSSTNPPNAEGLISSPAVFGRFSNITGQCVIDPHKAPVPTYELPSFTELKNKYYDQSKLGTPPTSAPSRPGLVAHFSFDDGTATDLSGNANNGTLGSSGGDAGPTPIIDDGKKALKLGTYHYVNIPDSPSLATSQVTIETWVKPTLECPQYTVCDIFTRRNSSNIGGVMLISFPIHSPYYLSYFQIYVNGSWRVLDTPTLLVINTWNHIVGTYDGTTQKLYINGQLVKSQNIVGTINNPSTPIPRIGNQTVDGSTRYGGSIIDDLKIYNRALTATEIAEDYDPNLAIVGKTYKYSINKATATQNDFDTRTNGIYYISGNLEINSDVTATSKRTTVAFVNGDLNIKSNYTFGDNSNGTVFVVKGKVNIDRTVTRVDGVLISFAENPTDAYTICSASETDGSCPKDIITTSPLTINGSLISLSSDSNKTIRFRRNLTTNTSPAEIINSQAKYVAILNNLFSSDLKVWSEVQD